jgi:hypothetical protein
MQGVLLPGAVVPGIVLGGLLGVPGTLCEFDGLGFMPGTDPEPLFTAEHGGMLLGLCVPGVFCAPGVLCVPVVGLFWGEFPDDVPVEEVEGDVCDGLVWPGAL